MRRDEFGASARGSVVAEMERDKLVPRSLVTRVRAGLGRLGSSLSHVRFRPGTALGVRQRWGFLRPGFGARLHVGLRGGRP